MQSVTGDKPILRTSRQFVRVANLTGRAEFGEKDLDFGSVGVSTPTL
jgi:hypothetical protein